MRHAVLAVCVAIAFATAPTGASAQSALVDLSKPQSGKSRFVLNADLTPANLGAAEEEKPQPAAAAARVPACGEGCTMEQPDMPREARSGYRRDPYSYRTRNGTRVILVGSFGSKQAQQTAKPAPAPRRTFRFRRR